MWRLVIGGPAATAAVDAWAEVAGRLGDEAAPARGVIGSELRVLPDRPEEEHPASRSTAAQMIIVRTAEMLGPRAVRGESAPKPTSARNTEAERANDHVAPHRPGPTKRNMIRNVANHPLNRVAHRRPEPTKRNMIRSVANHRLTVLHTVGRDPPNAT
jgi:hypothetical protein